MKEEIDALQKNWNLECYHTPSIQKGLGCKWIYETKLKYDGTIKRYKELLIILQNTRVEREDFTEAFAPVTKLVTIRTLLAVTITWVWKIHQIDAFLHGDLNEEVYVKLSPGF